MRIRIIFIIFLLHTFTFAQEKSSIAVLELEPVGLSSNEAQVLSNRLRTELFKTDKFTVLERDKMDEILIEQGFQLSACTTNECAVEVGKLIGVEKMVAGNIAKIDNLFTIDIRLIDVETGEVIKTATEDCACELKDVLTNSIRNVARSMAGLEVENKTTNVKTYESNIQDDGNSGITEWEMMGISRESYVEYKRSGLTKNQWIYKTKNKNVTTAMLLSIFLPAGGQYYNGDYWLGLAQQFAMTGGIVLSEVAGLDRTDPNDPKRDFYGTYKENNIYYIGYSISVCVWIWSWLDARSSAINYNEELKKKYKLSFTPKINKYSKKPMLGLNIEF